MIPIHRRFILGAGLLAALAATGASRAEPAGESPPEVAAARFIPLETDRPRLPAAAMPAETGVPTIRRLDAEDAVSGAEPDPESFDRNGLEAWWRHFQEKPRNGE
jgi:hypothetical protein